MDYQINNEPNRIVFIFKDKEIYDNFNEKPYSEVFVELIKENKDLFMDFSQVAVVDSLFIGSLIILKKSIEMKNKKMTLHGLNEHLKDLFEKLNLAEFFEH